MDSAVMYDDHLYVQHHHQPLPHHRFFHPGTAACGSGTTSGSGAGTIARQSAGVLGSALQPLLEYSPLSLEPDAKWRRLSENDDVIDDLPNLASTPDIENFLFQTSLPGLGAQATPLDAIADDDNVLSLLVDDVGCGGGGAAMVTDSSLTQRGPEVSSSVAVSFSTESNVLFPGLVTAEQEAYARGFVDALEELRRHDSAPNFTVHHRPKPASANDAVGCNSKPLAIVVQRSSSVLPVALVGGQIQATSGGQPSPMTSVNKCNAGSVVCGLGRLPGSAAAVAGAVSMQRPDVVPANLWFRDDDDRVFWKPPTNHSGGIGQQQPSPLQALPTFNAVLPPPLRHHVGGTVYQQTSPPSAAVSVSKFNGDQKAKVLTNLSSVCEIVPPPKVVFQSDLLLPGGCVKSPSGDVRITRSPLSGFDVELAQTVPRLGLTPPLSVTSSTSADDRSSMTMTSSGGQETTDDDDAEPSPGELARADRKRERNRLAARKCRSRKLEQIATLEARCAVLRAENDALTRSASGLAGDVTRLREQLSRHVAIADCRLGAISFPNWRAAKPTSSADGVSAAAASAGAATEIQIDSRITSCAPETRGFFATGSMTS